MLWYIVAHILRGGYFNHKKIQKKIKINKKGKEK